MILSSWLRSSGLFQGAKLSNCAWVNPYSLPLANLQRKIRKVIEHDGTDVDADAVHGRGIISGGGRISGGSGPPEHGGGAS